MPTPPDLPLLFPCGSIRKDTLPVKLKSQGFSLTEVVCYETCASADIGQRLTSVVKEKVRMRILEWNGMLWDSTVYTYITIILGSVNIIH